MSKKIFMFLIILFFISCDTYGELLNFNGGELYYTSNITSYEAHQLGNYCVQEGFFDGNLKTVQLDKNGNTYEFRMVIKKGLENDPEILDLMKIWAYSLSQDVFNGSQVDIHLCDEYLKTLRVVKYF